MQKLFLSLVFIATITIAGCKGHCRGKSEVTFKNRIPEAYFMTSGSGESDEGIPPEPYETFSYDLALQEAGIENFNVMEYTSVLPPESYEITRKEAEKDFRHGAVMEAIQSKIGGVKGDTVVAGVGRVWATDAEGKEIGGFAAEYLRIYTKQAVSPEQAKKDAIAQLTRSLNHELKIRGLKETAKGKVFEVKSLTIKKNYGMVIAAICFVSYIYPFAEHKGHKGKDHKDNNDK